MFLDRELRVGVWKKKGLRNSGQSTFPEKSLYEKYKSNHKRCCSSVSRLRIVSSRVYEEWGSLSIEHLNERKRKNFC
ncbi:Uncharacterized protein FWK35_00019503 [Aphis craccivora]|uniref:Uncharacterized protein n=1 Tax=Aphis craccivora TaxID=307492 RepID=A0A6G0Y8Y9_APHCR|nr:Uncharacterized protein FWK35_00019503 [Aphis craccivora]